MQTMTEDKMLSVEEVSKQLGLSQDSVLRRLRQGTLTGYNLEGTWRVKQSDLDKYLEERKNQPPRNRK